MPSSKMGGRLRRHALFLVVLAVAIAFRCYRLTDESLWNDETASILCMDAGSLRAFIAEERLDDPAMAPLYFMLEYACWHATSGSVLACRLLSIAFGLGAIVLLYAMGRRLFGSCAALVAAGCAAAAIQQVYYSQEIRMYALYLFTAMAAMYAFHRMLSGDGPVWWVLCGVTNAAMVWSHLYGVWLLFAQGVLVLAVRRRDVRALVVWGAIHGPIVLSIAVWVATMDPARIERNLNWIPGIRSEETAQYLSESALSLTERPPAHDPAPRLDQALRLPLAAKGLLGVAWFALPVWAGVALFRARRKLTAGGDEAGARRQTFEFVLVAAWLAVPALVLVFLTLVWRPTFLPRYVLPSTLALYLLLGAGVAAIPGRRLRAGCALALIALYAYDTASFGVPRRPDMRGAMAVVAREPFGHGVRVLIHPSGYLGPARFYSGLPDEALVCVRKWPAIPETVDSLEGRPVWIVVGALQGAPPDAGPLLEERGHAFDYHYFPGMFPVRLYRVHREAP